MSDISSEQKTKSQPSFPWERTKPYHFYPFAMWLVWGLAHILFSIRVVGRENLPKKSKGVILACNHLHSIDPGFLMMATRKKWRFIAKAELFRNPVVSFLFRHANAFPVDRDAIDRHAMDFALEVMKDKHYGLGIFPEGQRSPNGQPQEAKSGIAMIARQTKADILPCSLYHEGKLKFRRKIVVRIGEVIPFAELGLGDTPNKRQTRAACEKIMGEITKLWEQKNN